jgi:hypothetical protein
MGRPVMGSLTSIGLWLAQRVGTSVDLKALERAQGAVEHMPGVVAAATTGCSTATEFNTIRVVLNRGFDIGIATVNRQRVLSKSSTERCSGAVPADTSSAGGVSTPVPLQRS